MRRARDTRASTRRACASAISNARTDALRETTRSTVSAFPAAWEQNIFVKLHNGGHFSDIS